jgi:hypothetical protein
MPAKMAELLLRKTRLALAQHPLTRWRCFRERKVARLFLTRTSDRLNLTICNLTKDKAHHRRRRQEHGRKKIARSLRSQRMFRSRTRNVTHLTRLRFTNKREGQHPKPSSSARTTAQLKMLRTTLLASALDKVPTLL